MYHLNIIVCVYICIYIDNVVQTRNKHIDIYIYTSFIHDRNIFMFYLDEIS